jgi:hypothetical protein
MWQLLTISPGSMANFAPKNPKKTYVAFDFFWIITIEFFLCAKVMFLRFKMKNFNKKI